MKKYTLLLFTIIVIIFSAKVTSLKGINVSGQGYEEKVTSPVSNVTKPNYGVLQMSYLGTDTVGAKQNFGIKSMANGVSEDESLAPSKSFVCGDDIRQTIRRYWKYLVILAPIALMVLITFDFIKALISNDSDEIRKSAIKSMKRAIATLILFFTPMIVKIVFTWFGIENVLCF